MKLELLTEQEAFIEDQVTSGNYPDADAVVRAALDLLQIQERQREADLTALLEEVDRRLAALDRGEFVAPDVAYAELKELVRQAAGKAA